MTLFSRWIKNLWQEISASESYSMAESQPPVIRQRLDRYTSS